MIAIIKTGGKQHVVHEKDVIKVEKLASEVGASVTLDVMLVGNDDGSSIKIGAPMVAGAKVEAKVLEQGRTAKIAVGKYKNKTRYRRFNTHRQPWTKLEIVKIAA
jgi:large subunit ribosomal protein L21